MYVYVLESSFYTIKLQVARAEEARGYCIVTASETQYSRVEAGNRMMHDGKRAVQFYAFSVMHQNDEQPPTAVSGSSSFRCLIEKVIID